ncbi:hypothetical protein VNO78_13880 [Psophocarpus tetragonolobus]|uniref:Uncharacterized protein n=1 Tax=Psophocarpus tetragonolobus TaxID=3891 RepID=A0AAN9SQK8_PSOTE
MMVRKRRRPIKGIIKNWMLKKGEGSRKTFGRDGVWSVVEKNLLQGLEEVRETSEVARKVWEIDSKLGITCGEGMSIVERLEALELRDRKVVRGGDLHRCP